MPLLLFCISKKRPHRDANKKIIFFRTFCRPTHPAVLCVEQPKTRIGCRPMPT